MWGAKSDLRTARAGLVQGLVGVHDQVHQGAPNQARIDSPDLSFFDPKFELDLDRNAATRGVPHLLKKRREQDLLSCGGRRPHVVQTRVDRGGDLSLPGQKVVEELLAFAVL